MILLIFNFNLRDINDFEYLITYQLMFMSFNLTVKNKFNPFAIHADFECICKDYTEKSHDLSKFLTVKSSKHVSNVFSCFNMTIEE